MSIIVGAIKHAVSKIPGAGHLSKVPYLTTGLKGLGTAASLTTGGVFGYYSYGHEYGAGTAGLYAVASTAINPFLFIGLEQSFHAVNQMYKTQQSKRKSSFAKSLVDDRFGTRNRMLQHSIQKLNRDISSSGRVLNNEAFYLHR